MFLGRDPAAGVWKEWHLQAYVVQEARRAGYLIAGDMAAGKRNPGLAKATGLLAGEPDLRIYLPEGRLVLIELKTDKGRLSPAQIEHHARLLELGHVVHVVYAATPESAWEQINEILLQS